MFFKKDLLLFLKDWKGISLVLVSPVVLILILGFAVRGISEEKPANYEVKAALVIEGDAEAEIAAFVESLAARPMDDDERTALAAAAEASAPSRLLLDVLEREEVASWATMTPMDAVQAKEALGAGETDAVLTVPAGFDAAGLSRMLLGEGPSASVTIMAGPRSGFGVRMLEETVESFARSLSLHSAVSRQLTEAGVAEAELRSAAWQDVAQPTGGLDPESDMAPVTSYQYYTFSMTVLFVLFIASNTAGRAFREKRQLVYDRIRLADRSPFRYLAAKTASAALFAWLQLMIVFVVVNAVLRVFPGSSVKLWLGLALISAALALFVGGLGALLTAINYRFDKPAAGMLFAGVGVTLMAMLGGSMGPLARMPDWINFLSVWTPNGLALSVYVQWLQELSPGALLQPLLILGVGAALLVAVGGWIFPWRRRAA
ncbi:ABC transporter permease [Paenibacillus sp. 598K]|uniref:ABC transporter permease n=1 Tax=Paenibacillus sp. 598K TaxID=1117987 RepID=UPI000FF97EB4|nr:ABC transporter permease [Paenibacillus sp. 598K]GBF76098.1 ABC transporter permease [Paenibacillus sp. 598K]